MSQQASIIKLKEQIVAAKRSLSEMPLVASDNAVNEDSSASNADSDCNSSAGAALINLQSTDIPKIQDTTVVDLSVIVDVKATKVAEINGRESTINKVKTDHLDSSSSNSTYEGFHFFHRKKQAMNVPVTGLENLLISDGDLISRGDTGNSLFEDFNCRLKAIEIDVAQNRLHIDELIKISSGLASSRFYTSKPKSVRHLVRRYVFWLVIGCLAIGWFALTPSGRTGINYLLTVN